jgi:hypothetical protein
MFSLRPPGPHECLEVLLEVFRFCWSSSGSDEGLQVLLEFFRLSLMSPGPEEGLQVQMEVFSSAGSVHVQIEVSRFNWMFSWKSPGSARCIAFSWRSQRLVRSGQAHSPRSQRSLRRPPDNSRKTNNYFCV